MKNKFLAGAITFLSLINTSLILCDIQVKNTRQDLERYLEINFLNFERQVCETAKKYISIDGLMPSLDD